MHEKCNFEEVDVIQSPNSGGRMQLILGNIENEQFSVLNVYAPIKK